MRRGVIVGLFAVCFAALLAALVSGLTAWRSNAAPPTDTPASADALGDLLGGDVAGYARALAPRAFDFPQDHGPHPDYKHEWWYWTGNLRAPDGRRFGFQLTFFRIALTPAPVSRASAWAGDQVYMAHLALTDLDGRRFYHTQRLSRAALGLAGAQAAPFRVWLEDWVAVGRDDGPFPLRLQAAGDDFCD